MRSLTRVALLLLAAAPAAPAAPAVAQAPNSDARPFTFSAALGPAHAFRGVDSRGIEAHLAATHRLGNNFGARLEGAGHWYADQALYPCLVQDELRCYQVMRRVVSAAVLNVTYHVTRFADDKDRTVPYVISGIGIYRSRRIATHYPDCEPSGACTDRGTYRLEFRDTQLGWSGGLGLDFELGHIPAFMEMRVHYIYRDSPAGKPPNDYFLFPLSVGLRF